MGLDLGEKVNVLFRITEDGNVSVQITDRDGFVVRDLISDQPAKVGALSYEWAATDNSGEILPSEAYAVRIRFTGKSGTDTYDPLSHFHPVYESPENPTYARASGTLGYKLSRNARVHFQVGVSRTNPKTGKEQPAIMRTIVDREPRMGGSVVEAWNGYETGGKIYIPDLPGFFISIFAESLPENSIILTGKSEPTFYQYALAHRPKDAIKPRAISKGDHMHHMGLTALEDRSPEISVTCSNASWDENERHWKGDGPLALKVSVDSETAPFFLSQPSELQIFVDGNLSKYETASKNPFSTSLGPLSPGEHVVTVDWVSKFGPVGVQNFKVWFPSTLNHKDGAK
jgi:hypothetical protein